MSPWRSRVKCDTLNVFYDRWLSVARNKRVVGLRRGLTEPGAIQSLNSFSLSNETVMKHPAS